MLIQLFFILVLLQSATSQSREPEKPLHTCIIGCYQNSHSETYKACIINCVQLHPPME